MAVNIIDGYDPSLHIRHIPSVIPDMSYSTRTYGAVRQYTEISVFYRLHWLDVEMYEWEFDISSHKYHPNIESLIKTESTSTEYKLNQVSYSQVPMNRSIGRSYIEFKISNILSISIQIWHEIWFIFVWSIIW